MAVLKRDEQRFFCHCVMNVSLSGKSSNPFNVHLLLQNFSWVQLL